MREAPGTRSDNEDLPGDNARSSQSSKLGWHVTPMIIAAQVGRGGSVHRTKCGGICARSRSHDREIRVR